MQIIRCDSSHDAQWNEFVQASPQASFYHRAEWRGINERCFGHQTAYLAAVDGGRMAGVFPLVRLKSMLFGSIACSLPFMNYGGPCGECPDVERALLEAGSAVADKWRVDYVEIRSRHHLGAEYPTSEHKVSMTVELGPDPEVLFNAFDRDHRREIRKGQKNGYVARFGGAELLDDFYVVMSESWRDLGTPIFAKSYIRAICDAFPTAIRICVVYDAAGTPAATAFDGLHATIVEGMWLGIRGDHKRQGVGYVLYWELIKHACEAGYASHHLGRSSVNSGAEQFKKKWNAQTVQLYWHYILRSRAEIPTLNPSSPKYQLAIKAWQKLPLSVTKMLGPFISRSIP
jgi:FemAB-related protein (PEP-CTERM system-associated)